MELISILILIAASALCLGHLLLRLIRVDDDAGILLFAKYTIGLSFYYLLILIGTPLNVVLYLLWVPPICFVGWVAWTRRSGLLRVPSMHPLQFLFLLVFVAGAVYVSMEVLKFIAFRPINEWDSRSIWYFRAKQLYFANGLNSGTGIAVNNYTSRWCHPEYPFLVPSFSALIAKWMGFWNEFMPKTNLYLLWFGMLLGVGGLKHVHALFRLLIFTVLLMMSPYFLGNGYNDIWLGTFISIAILYVIEYIRLNDSKYLTTALCVMLFCLSVKQDAFLLNIAVLLSFVAVLVVTRQKQLLLTAIHNLRQHLIVYALLLMPMLVWTYHKNVLHIGSSEYDFSRLLHISEYGTTFSGLKIDLIYNAIVAPMALPRMLLVLSGVGVVAIIVMKFIKSTTKDQMTVFCLAFLPLIATVLFTFGMHIVYCMSTADLAWHLSTSADRLRMHLMFLALPSLFGVASGLLNIPLMFDKKLTNVKGKGKGKKSRK